VGTVLEQDESARRKRRSREEKVKDMGDVKEGTKNDPFAVSRF
jgi:hypothetical protein